MAASSYLLAAAVKRLLHDLREVQENAMPNVSCLPLQDDLFTWHGNVRSCPGGTLKGAPIHFILSFPHDYPYKQPECRLLQSIPHPNVKLATSSGTIQVLHADGKQHPVVSLVYGSAAACRPHPIPRQARWRLALWDCIPGKNSWSSAYSVLSIMLQLQVFLLDEDLHYDHQQVTPDRAIAKALELDCPDCPHAGSDSNVYPPFPSANDLAAAKSLRGQQAVSKPFVPARSRTTALHLKAHQKEVRVQAPIPTASAAVNSPLRIAGSNDGYSAAVKSCNSSNGGASAAAAAVTARSSCSSTSSSTTGDDCSTDDQWVTVMSKGRSNRGSHGSSNRHTAEPHALAAAPTTAVAGGRLLSNSRFAVLRAASSQQQQELHQPTVAVAPAPSVPGLPQQQPQQQQQQLSKAAKKNLARARKRQEATSPSFAAAVSSAATVACSGNGPKPAQASSCKAASAPRAATVISEAWTEVGGKKAANAAKQQAEEQLYNSPLQQQLRDLQQQPMSVLIQQCMAGDSFKASAAAVECPASGCSSSSKTAAADLWSQQQHYTSASAAAAGAFSCLPQDALLCILGQLYTADVAHLSQTCKALNAATSDGAVWQLMMARCFPGARLTASSMADWKAAYLLESSCVLSELKCWYTRADFHEDVLGLPLSYTVNPVTHKVDYILAHPDLLSVTAFKAGVKLTPTGEKFDALLPVYITADHFNRALPHLEPLLKQLAPEHMPRGGGCPAPETWLEVIPKILNTQVVLLADNGIAASQKSLSISCQVHRLLLAVCEHWVLWPKVSVRLDAFLQHPAQRVKAACPNLGMLLPLLSCSPSKHSWGKMSAALLQEALDRKVLWMCKKDPHLVKSFQAAPGNPVDMTLLRGSWAGAAVSCRLLAFHLAFLQLVAAPKGSSLEAVMDSMDAMYGWPSAALGPKFTNVVRRIQQLDGWQSWFQLLGCKIPTAAAMSDLLRSAWCEGEKKGYHSAKTDFSKIHASGVSRILLKGQSYSTPPGTKSVELEVHYKWKPEFTVRYLDGAVLLFGPGRQFTEMIAWNNRSSRSTARPGAVTHSGDIMEFGQQQGLNKAKVVFDGLGPDICEAFITLSAWSDAMLSDIIQPYVQLKEPSTGVELCQCHLDSKDMVTKKAHKCIIMARLYREPAGGWGVQAVGSFCQGNTGAYMSGGREGNTPLTQVGKMVQGIKALSL